MTITRAGLEALALEDSVISRILEAHEEALRQLQSELDAARGEAEVLRGEREAAVAREASLSADFEAFRRETEAAAVAAGRLEALHAALRRAGANEQVIPLLAGALSVEESMWEGTALLDEAAAIAPAAERYPGLFAAPEPLPTDPVSPPISGGAPLSPGDVRRMTPDEINRSWSLVRSALMRS